MNLNICSLVLDFHYYNDIYCVIFMNHVSNVFYIDKNQDQYSDVNIITNDNDFTSFIKSRNFYSYKIEDNAKNSRSLKSYMVIF